MATMPVPKGFEVTSPFGPRWGTIHKGTDFGRQGGAANQPIFAVRDGTVIMTGAAQGYGGPGPAGWIVIDHPASVGGGTSEYGHIISEVAVGQKVREGQRIGYINPNQATNGGVAPHLHFSWMPKGYNPSAKIDPMTTVLAGAKWPGGEQAASSAVATPEVNPRDIFDIDWSQKFWENGTYSPKRLIVLHTTENSAKSTVEGVATFQLGPENTWKGAYTGLVDSRGAALRANTDDQKVPAAANISNSYGLHLSLVGWSSWKREEWLAQEKMLRRAARIVADWSTKHGIPIRRLTAEQIKAGSWGITDHNGTRLAYGKTTHTDVGPGFPWDVFLEMVNDAMKPKLEATMTEPIAWPDGPGALNEAKIAATEARDTLRTPVPSLINPKKLYEPLDLLRIVDAQVWEQRHLLEALCRKQGLDPARIVADAKALDRGVK
ncbi:peptidoglycan DD-metalloendopeptidase family protein [Corynebacterium bouchesdurhonense]|uniref:peptidoglycan DD-metalloendopeptidase family protein n=1 Tax=Corynebacterium bouchesdurhonense TaxID=1720192 RepID=UPI0008320E0A|nr:peptidoglycan DD-metalloendopeptidase family protein [Corynebacterium bouchesdurhonense]